MPEARICRSCGSLEWMEEYRETVSQYLSHWVESDGRLDESWGDSDSVGDSEATGDELCERCNHGDLIDISDLTGNELAYLYNLSRESRVEAAEAILRGETPEVYVEAPPENCKGASEERCKSCPIAGKSCLVPEERGWT